MANRKTTGIRKSGRIRTDGRVTPDEIERIKKKSSLGGNLNDPTLIPSKVKEAAKEYGMNEHEMLLINSYTDGLYWDLNQAILHNAVDDPTKVAIRALNKALDKAPTFEGVTYRGMGIDFEQREALMEKLKSPGGFKFGTFVSTSRQQDVAANWGGSAAVVFVIHGKKGRDIDRLSGHDSEDEVLFKAGTKFKFVKLEDMEMNSYGDKITRRVIHIREVA